MHTCEVCGASRHVLAKFCPDCKRLIGRLDTRRKHNKEARLAALKRSFHNSQFHCHYTGWPLTITDSSSPLYLTWDHRTPGDETDIVVAAAMVNDVKSDLTEDEFRTLVIGLANRFQSGAEVPPLKPKHWNRTTAKAVIEE